MIFAPKGRVHMTFVIFTGSQCSICSNCSSVPALICEAKQYITALAGEEISGAGEEISHSREESSGAGEESSELFTGLSGEESSHLIREKLALRGRNPANFAPRKGEVYQSFTPPENFGSFHRCPIRSPLNYR